MDNQSEILSREYQNQITEALFILGAREKESLADVAARRMRECGQPPGEVPPLRAAQMKEFVDAVK